MENYKDKTIFKNVKLGKSCYNFLYFFLVWQVGKHCFGSVWVFWKTNIF